MSKIQIGVPVLPTSYNMLAAGQLDVDYVVFYGQVVTIELDDTDEATVGAQIAMMRHYLNA